MGNTVEQYVSRGGFFNGNIQVNQIYIIKMFSCKRLWARSWGGGTIDSRKWRSVTPINVWLNYIIVLFKIKESHH